MAQPLAILEGACNQPVYFARDFLLDGLRDFFFTASTGETAGATARASHIASLSSTRR